MKSSKANRIPVLGLKGWVIVGAVAILGLACACVARGDEVTKSDAGKCAPAVEQRAAWIEAQPDHGVMAVFNVGKIFETVKTYKPTTHEVYVEQAVGIQAGEEYASAADGMPDAQPVEVTTNQVSKGIFQAMGDSIAAHPYGWSAGTLATLVGGYFVYAHHQQQSNGGSNQNATPPVPPTTGANSPSIAVNGDNNAVNVTVVSAQNQAAAASP